VGGEAEGLKTKSLSAFYVHQRAELALKERQKALEEMGIDIKHDGIGIDASKYYLVNMSSDPAMASMLLYYLKVVLQSVLALAHASPQKSYTRVGLHVAEDPPDISLEGTGIEKDHAVFLLEKEKVRNVLFVLRSCHNCEARFGTESLGNLCQRPQDEQACPTEERLSHSVRPQPSVPAALSSVPALGP
jgi:hypothetical protein